MTSVAVTLRPPGMRRQLRRRLVPMRLLGLAIDVVLVLVGLGLFVYGDLSVHRTARIAGVIITTLAIVVAAILASTRERDG